MTTIYFDTSVIMNESFLRSPYARAFLKACALLQYDVVIPEIVVDELKGNYPSKLKEKAKAFQKAQKELAKLYDLDIAEMSVPDAIEEFDNWFAELMDEHGVVEAPYPEIPVKELVEKSYEGSKPFKENGEGHKDYIVWHTIKRRIESDVAKPPHVFLTNNTSDFCEVDEDKNVVLHSDLAQQIENDALRPKIYTSIKSAFEDELSPHLEGMTLNDLPDIDAQGLDTLVGKYLLDDLPTRALYALEGVPFSNEISISMIGSHSISDVSLQRVDHEVIIEITGTVELEVSGFIDKHEYYHAEESNNNLYVEDGNWNDHVMLVGSSVETPFELTMFYSAEESEVTGYELSLPDEIHDEWPYK